MMNEQELRDRLATAASDCPPGPAGGDDLARGRRAHRRRLAAVTGATLATAAVVGTATALVALALPDHHASPAPLGVAHGGPRTPHPPPKANSKVKQPDQVTGTHAPPLALKRHERRLIGTGPDQTFPDKVWLVATFQLAQADLDPEHRYTSYDLNEQGSGGPGGSRSLGTRVTWQQPGETGMGDVSVEVGSPGSPASSDDCDLYGGCTPQHDPRFGDYLLGGDPTGGGGFVVIVTQADGEVAVISVNPLYGNNSLVPTTAPLPTLERVLTLATDAGLNLPS